MPAKIRPAAVLATLVGLAVAVILVLAGVVASSGAEAASKVSCGDTITTDATLHHNLVSCPNNGIIIVETSAMAIGETSSASRGSVRRNRNRDCSRLVTPLRIFFFAPAFLAAARCGLASRTRERIERLRSL